jgi:uncharacterized FAD-dependent dehydrogenase
MIRITELKLPLSAVPVEARRAADAPTETDADRAPAPHPIDALKLLAAKALGITPADIASLQVFKGFGPCGLFAALLLAQMGFRPIVLERGRDVRQRTKDTWALWRKNTLTPESNVQFGEGGAGLFSDGKLYSQIKDPKFYGRKVMHEFVKAGAPREILFVSKPHIGTFRLTGVVAAMREEIIALGGEVRFESRVEDLLLEDGRVSGVRLASGEMLHSRYVVLALGHSSRDTFRMLHRRGVFLEPKPFAIGFRIEHPQSSSTRPGWANTPDIPIWALPTTSWCTMPAMAAPSTVSACARAAPWWQPPRKRAAW